MLMFIPPDRRQCNSFPPIPWPSYHPSEQRDPSAGQLHTDAIAARFEGCSFLFYELIEILFAKPAWLLRPIRPAKCGYWSVRLRLLSVQRSLRKRPPARLASGLVYVGTS
jgi:hypothetical protein